MIDSSSNHQPLHGVPISTAPRFYITGRQPLRPEAILLATVLAVAVLSSITYALGHGQHWPKLLPGGNGRDSSAAGTASAEDKDDDPNQVDTIVLGDAADAPRPARRGEQPSPVHPFVVVHLPRFGDETGLIPNSPAGHLLYDWLAAFNQSNESALQKALPSLAADSELAAQMEFRKQTGGLNLLSAKEVQPGILVFRLRDQTREGNEVLGTLQMRPNSSPPAIASFSLRGVATAP